MDLEMLMRFEVWAHKCVSLDCVSELMELWRMAHWGPTGYVACNEGLAKGTPLDLIETR
jgi:hypothetical protein